MLAGGMPTHAEAVTLFERRRQAWLREDLTGYLDLWADDMSFASPVHTEPLCGRDAFGDLVRQSLAFSRPLRFNVERVAVDGDWVLAEWEITIVRRVDGREITWRGMSVCRIRDGRITEWREYWNPTALA